MGPLKGVKILEIAGIGPVPMCAMLLADMGADIIRVDRIDEADTGIPVPTKYDLTKRGRRSIAVNLKSVKGVELVANLASASDVLLEGFRPGVMERLGLGPDECMARNNQLVYGRMTGWGQTGPLSQSAGHDANYIALSGALAAIGTGDDGPVLPLNLVGDFGGGALYLAMGVLAALLEARTSGHGQVVDAAIVDGAANLITGFYGLMQAGMWNLQRESNFLDGGAHFYRPYKTRDGKYVVIAPLEEKFYKEFLHLMGLDHDEFDQQHNPEKWPEYTEKLSEIFATKTRGEWCAHFENSDACFAPVLSMAEAWSHEHAQARKTFVDIEGVIQPAPAPRFNRTTSNIQSPPCEPGSHTHDVLQEQGLSKTEIMKLAEAGVIHQSTEYKE